MFWRTLLISFVLNNKRNFWNLNVSRKNGNIFSNYIEYIDESLPFDDTVPENNNETIDVFNSKKRFFRNILNNGYDYRIDTNELYEREKIRNISLIFKKMLLLQNLENDNVSQNTKIELIENHNMDSNINSKYVSNINSGNLFSDW
jgi:hypothetical protein